MTHIISADLFLLTLGSGLPLRGGLSGGRAGFGLTQGLARFGLGVGGRQPRAVLRAVEAGQCFEVFEGASQRPPSGPVPTTVATPSVGIGEVPKSAAMAFSKIKACLVLLDRAGLLNNVKPSPTWLDQLKFYACLPDEIGKQVFVERLDVDTSDEFKQTLTA